MNPLERLREVFPIGSTVITVVRHVSASGMSRAVQVLGTDPETCEIEDYTHLLISAGLRKRFGNHPGVRVNGYGMDMAWHTTYSLAHDIHGDGYALKNRTI